MFGFFERSVKAAVDVTVDTVEYPLGGEGPKREDIATVATAGLAVLGAASILDALDGDDD